MEEYNPMSGVRTLELIDRSKGKSKIIDKKVSRSKEEYNQIVEIWKPYCNLNPGVRIYSSVDERSMEKGMKVFKHMLIDLTDLSKAPLLFVKAMSQMESRSTKYLHFDVDWKDHPFFDGNMFTFLIHMRRFNPKILHYRETPKGMHIVTERFDWRKVGMEPKKNSLLYVYGK